MSRFEQSFNGIVIAVCRSLSPPTSKIVDDIQEEGGGDEADKEEVPHEPKSGQGDKTGEIKDGAQAPNIRVPFISLANHACRKERSPLV